MDAVAVAGGIGIQAKVDVVRSNGAAATVDRADTTALTRASIAHRHLGHAGQGAGAELDGGDTGERAVPVDGPGARGGRAGVDEQVLGGLDQDSESDRALDLGGGAQVKDTGDGETEQGGGRQEGDGRGSDLDVGEGQEGLVIRAVTARVDLALDADTGLVVDLGHAIDLGGGDAPLEAVHVAGEDVLEACLSPGHVCLG